MMIDDQIKMEKSQMTKPFSVFYSTVGDISDKFELLITPAGKRGPDHVISNFLVNLDPFLAHLFHIWSIKIFLFEITSKDGKS